MKKNLSEVFRHIPVAKKDGGLLDFQWESEYGIDRFLPFGLRTSPYIFDLFAKGFHGMLINKTSTDPAPYNDFFNVSCKLLNMSINVNKN